MSALPTDVWPSVRTDSVLVVPLGSTEQHGPHLPFATDTIIATALAQTLMHVREVTVAPAMPYGSSGEHQDFPGTLSIGNNVLHEFILELVRSATCTFAGVYFINGHGGNLAAIASALQLLEREGRAVHSFAPHLDGSDLHAGVFETSLLLHLAPELVREDALVAGDTRPLHSILPELQRAGVRSVSETGVLGDAHGSSASRGDEYFGLLREQLLADFDAWLLEQDKNKGSQHG